MNYDLYTVTQVAEPFSSPGFVYPTVATKRAQPGSNCAEMAKVSRSIKVGARITKKISS